MKKVLTVGVFDYFHYGHYKLFERAKSLGDYLVVAVQDEKVILKYKSNAHILYSTEQRVELVRALRIVDEVIVYSDVDQVIKQVDFDIFVVGEDQTHIGFCNAIEWCEKHDKRVVRMQRTPGICSSDIKDSVSQCR